MVDDTSWPYAPTFWIGVAPAEPGIPARHSMPARPASTVRATASVQTSPAASSSAVPSSVEALGRDAQGGAVEALVADDQVAAAADDQQRRAAVVGLADGGDHLGVGRRREQAGRGAAEPEGGQGGEGGVVEFLHGDKSTVRGPTARAGPRTACVAGPWIRRRPGPVPRPASAPASSGPTAGRRCGAGAPGISRAATRGERHHPGADPERGDGPVREGLRGAVAALRGEDRGQDRDAEGAADLAQGVVGAGGDALLGGADAGHHQVGGRARSTAPCRCR